MIIIYYTDKEGKITAWPEDASSILREAVTAGGGGRWRGERG